MTHPDLPRLLYVAEVPVEASYHGSALVHRLLADYPVDRLAVVETSIRPSEPARRLAGVAYHHLPQGLMSFYNRSLGGVRTGILVARGARRARPALTELADSFAPQAVLTVSHGPSWLEAASLARQRSLPLHLLCHDDWMGTLKPPLGLKAIAERLFASRYRQAAARFCVSPYMEQRYAAAYGAPGVVLLPSRSPTIPAYDAPPPRVATPERPFTMAFAGSMHGPYPELIKMAAQALAAVDGRLLVFGPAAAADLQSAGVTQANVQVRGMLPAEVLVRTLREEADALYAPQSFWPQDRDVIMFGFSSKLTDYTATGLPILLHGPSYWSAIPWAQANPGAFSVVTSDRPEALGQAIADLAHDADYRTRLAVASIALGRRAFDAKAAAQTFHAHLIGAAATGA